MHPVALARVRNENVLIFSSCALVLKPAKSLSAADRAALEAEALALAVFLAADAPTHEVKFEAGQPRADVAPARCSTVSS